MGRLDVGTVDFAIGCDVGDFTPLGGKQILPVAVPLGFVLPPRVAVLLVSVGPVVNHAGTAFGDHAGAARGAQAFALREGFAAIGIYESELHADAVGN